MCFGFFNRQFAFRKTILGLIARIRFLKLEMVFTGDEKNTEEQPTYACVAPKHERSQATSVKKVGKLRNWNVKLF